MKVLIDTVSEKEKTRFNVLATHPLQSYEWGEFRKKTGVKVIRVVEEDADTFVRVYQLTIHKIPKLPFTIGYLPKGPTPDGTMLETLLKIGKENNCIFIKIEPNVEASDFNDSFLELTDFRIKIPYKGLFTKYSFVLDLSPSEDELLKQMKEKTRYNIRLATRRGVTIQEDASENAFKKYLDLTFETTKRQNFYAHNRAYHTSMWKTLHPSGIAHLLTAVYEGKILVTWVVFLFNDILYYPYGASSSEHREVMASNMMMWETIRWGKEKGAKKFDMWGALPPNSDPQDPRMGFHRFKEGYGAKLVEFAGSYDLVLNPFLYSTFTIASEVRARILGMKH